MDADRVFKLGAFAGFGLLAIGAFYLWRHSSQQGLQAFRPTGVAGFGDGNPQPRYVNGRFERAPIVGGYNDGRMKTQLRESPDMPIEQRLAEIQDLVHKSVQDPEMRRLALHITRNCPERDGMCETRAIYKAVKKRVRYTGDVAPIAQGANGPVDGIDLYQSARRTWQFRGGDCDDHSVLVTTLLALNGIEPRLRVTKEQQGLDWGHIYGVAMLPKTMPSKAVALDTTLPGYRFNYEVPYAEALDFPA